MTMLIYRLNNIRNVLFKMNDVTQYNTSAKDYNAGKYFVMHQIYTTLCLNKERYSSDKIAPNYLVWLDDYLGDSREFSFLAVEANNVSTTATKLDKKISELLRENK